MLPKIFPAVAQNTAAQGDNAVRSSDCPVHTRLFQALPNDGSASCLQNAGTYKETATRGLIAMLSSWRHSGFHVFCGNRISPNDETAMENLARYIIRVSFSQERMQYLDQEGKVVYASKDGKSIKVSPAVERLAAMCSHIPNRGEQMVRYYGIWNTIRGYSLNGNPHVKSNPKVTDK
jgi:hypothetical protein